MKWRNKIIISTLSILLPVLFSVFWVSSSYAIDDITYTFDSMNIPAWYKLCGNEPTDPFVCLDYSFIKVEYLDTCGNTLSSFILGSTYNISVPVCPSGVIIPITSEIPEIWLTGGRSGSYSGNVTLIFTNNIGGGSCPICPVVPDNPYDDKLDKIITAIYVVPATMLVVYFFYCIYRIIIKTTGGK